MTCPGHMFSDFLEIDVAHQKLLERCLLLLLLLREIASSPQFPLYSEGSGPWAL